MRAIIHNGSSEVNPEPVFRNAATIRPWVRSLRGASSGSKNRVTWPAECILPFLDQVPHTGASTGCKDQGRAGVFRNDKLSFEELASSSIQDLPSRKALIA